MTLEESTTWALAALEAGDLQDVARAIHARREAIAEVVRSGRPPAPRVLAQVIAAGERLGNALDAARRELYLESARLRYMESRFSSSDSDAHQISLRG